MFALVVSSNATSLGPVLFTPSERLFLCYSNSNSHHPLVMNGLNKPNIQCLRIELYSAVRIRTKPFTPPMQNPFQNWIGNGTIELVRSIY